MYFLNFYKIILILYFFLPLLPPSHLCPCCVTCLGFIVLVATWYPSNHPRSFKSDWLPSAYKFISCLFADSIRLLIWPPYDKPSPRLWNEVSKQLAKTSKRHYMHIYVHMVYCCIIQTFSCFYVHSYILSGTIMSIIAVFYVQMRGEKTLLLFLLSLLFLTLFSSSSSSSSVLSLSSFHISSYSWIIEQCRH